ncbi:MAG TPA: PhoU domain-containing protein, partial [Aggregatilineales bacterium]|nr:PhoU domain-containing protein [Aggregatilineales bacterium]
MSGIASKLDEELRTLRDDVLRLSSMVDTAMQTAMRAVWEFKPTVAQEVIRDDTAINDFRFKIEERCYILLAMQQPTARDMRSVITASHTVVELDR